MPASRHPVPAKGLVIAAPSSGAGKTTLTLGLLRALRNKGYRVASAKSGPDYIDPKFHEAASGDACLNLDAWAMSKGTLGSLANTHAAGRDLMIVEGAMGLFDGAANGRGSVADLAAFLRLPVVLVVDCAKQAQSVAALVSGFANHRDDVSVPAVILNRVGSARHEKMLRQALEPIGMTVLGALPRADELVLPERHLGLVQATEHAKLEDFLETAAAFCTDNLDLEQVQTTASEISGGDQTIALPSPLGQRIAIAEDIAFSFAYPHLLEHWRQQGAELDFFSPLKDETPVSDADAIFLPGGYPELHAGTLVEAKTFQAGMKTAAKTGTLIYGECGGYMMLGEGLIDADGQRHAMLGLLPLETSFADRRRHLGYRRVVAETGLPWKGPLAAHEFHYARVTFEGDAPRLFSAEDAEGVKLPDMGLQLANVMGSFAHVIA